MHNIQPDADGITIDGETFAAAVYDFEPIATVYLQFGRQTSMATGKTLTTTR